jgi:hypothetical protein
MLGSVDILLRVNAGTATSRHVNRNRFELYSRSGLREYFGKALAKHKHRRGKHALAKWPPESGVSETLPGCQYVESKVLAVQVFVVQAQRRFDGMEKPVAQARLALSLDHIAGGTTRKPRKYRLGKKLKERQRIRRAGHADIAKAADPYRMKQVSKVRANQYLRIECHGDRFADRQRRRED